jgi:Zn-dependent protease with chaperone function
VLGHEISHNVCHHAAESMSTSILQWGAIVITGLLEYWDQGVVDYGLLPISTFAFVYPRSRRQESEADQIGLRLMAQACYDPREAERFWSRMDQADKFSVPTFMSTHPSNEQRIRQIHHWMGDAMDRYKNSGCGSTSEICKDN